MVGLNISESKVASDCDRIPIHKNTTYDITCIGKIGEGLRVTIRNVHGARLINRRVSVTKRSNCIIGDACFDSYGAVG